MNGLLRVGGNLESEGTVPMAFVEANEIVCFGPVPGELTKPWYIHDWQLDEYAELGDFDVEDYVLVDLRRLRNGHKPVSANGDHRSEMFSQGKWFAPLAFLCGKSQEVVLCNGVSCLFRTSCPVDGRSSGDSPLG